MQARSIRGARKIGTSISALSHAESLRLEKFTNEDLDPLDGRPKEAIRLRATRLAVYRRGKKVEGSPAPVSALSLPGRPSGVDVFLAHRERV